MTLFHFVITLLIIVPTLIISYVPSGVGWRGSKILSFNPSPLRVTSSGRRSSLPASVVPQASTALSDDNIFCNRELNMNQIQAVGFDMDYTLAQYKEEFDLLAYNGAKNKLIEWMKYPIEISELNYTPDITRRGCMVDKKRGNVLKLDQHRYVRAVEHGLTPLSREERKAVYRSSYQDTERFTSSGYSNIDTPFSLVDACLYAQLVDYKDSLVQPSSDASISPDTENQPEDTARLNLIQKSYADVWNDLRVCVERCHRDGTIKLAVAQDPARYIVYDPQLFIMLNGLRRAGKKVFLLTNSLFDYTQAVMNHMYQCFLRDQHSTQEKSGDDKSTQEKSGDDKESTWMDYFDVIIAGGNKPAFLLDEGSLTLFKVNPTDNTLANCGRTPQSAEQGAKFLQQHGKVFQGGNAQILHHLLQMSPPLGISTSTEPREFTERLSSSCVSNSLEPETTSAVCALDSDGLDDEIPSCAPTRRETLSNAGRDGGLGVLYVGDHIFADILRSKRSLGWRTCLIVPELSAELQALCGDVSAAPCPDKSTRSGETDISTTPSELDPQQLKDELCRLKERQCQLENELDEIQCRYHHDQLLNPESAVLAAEPMSLHVQKCSKIIAELQRVRAEIRDTLAAYDAAFHPRWGQLFRAGFQESRISKQIKDYACIYTSKASNLAGVSHARPLRPTRDLMPHDHFIAGLN